MTPRALALILILTGLAASCTADTSTALPNGLRVVTVSAPGSEVCGLHLALKIGPERVPATKAGLRALTQQVLLQRMREQLNDTPGLASLRREGAEGAGFRIDTQWDTVEFTVSVTAAELPALLQFVAPAVFDAAWEQDDVVAAREAMAEEGEGPSGGVASTVVSLFLTALTGSVAQGQPMFGSEASREGISLADVRSYYRAFYVPNLASVCLVSPLPDAEAQTLLRAAFGGFAAREGMAAIANPPEPTEPQVQIGSSPAMEDALCMVGVPLPPVSSPEFPVARIIHAALSGPGGSVARIRLPGRPVRGLRDAAGREPMFDVVPLPLSQHPYIALFARVRPFSTESARTSMLGALLDFARQPLSDEDLARAKTRALNLELVSLEKPAEAAARINQGALLGEPEAPGAKLAEQMAKVTAQDVQQFASKYFVRHAVGVLMPGD